jgi:hypothetical protein
MTQSSHHPRISFTQPSQWVWNISLDGQRVGTVSGDRVGGFTARNAEFHTIGRGYDSAEAAMYAWVPVMEDSID